MVKLYKKYIENSQNRQEISLFIKPYFCYNTMTKGYINITDRKKRCVILKRMKHALKALKDNERWVREIALLRKEYEEK